MPTYIYSCACGYREEIMHAMGADVMVECSYCLVPMSRKPSVGAVAFVGTGWGKDA